MVLLLGLWAVVGPAAARGPKGPTPSRPAPVPSWARRTPHVPSCWIPATPTAVPSPRRQALLPPPAHRRGDGVRPRHRRTAPDAAVSATDGIRVSLRDANGTSCSYASARFGAGISPRPVTALGQRETGKALCQGGGTFHLLVERLDAGHPGVTAGAGRWDLEIAPVTEPRLVRAAPRPRRPPGTRPVPSPLRPAP
ncbi:hypothetical protein ACFQ3Z_23650 [Streptomyces nogalater]